METKDYTCQYCKKEYTPKRRRIQKFCSDSCRVGSHHQKNKQQNNKLAAQENTVLPKKTKVDQMSLAGVGNAAVGSAIVDSLKFLLTRSEDMPATKKDIENLEAKLQRFQRIKNMQPNHLLKFPFFDTELGILVYRLTSEIV